MAALKKVYLDIETAPIVGYTWGTWEQNVIEIVEDWYVLSMAWKWAGDKKIHSAKLPDYPGYRQNPRDDAKLLKTIWDVLNEADVVVAHNGDKFDLKKLTARFIIQGMRPPAPYKTIDTKKIASSIAGFSSNRLNDLAKALGVGEKEDPGGFETWKGCMAKDPASWRIMEKYNRMDVMILEPIEQKLLPWAKTYPNVGSIVGEDGLCPRCGSNRLQKRGMAPVGGGEAQRYQCMSCHGWSRGPSHKVTSMR
jgi:DNA polymerase elongation subunit (family B)